MDWMIHKYSLRDALVNDTITIPLPAGAQVLCVKTQTSSSVTRIHAQGATVACAKCRCCGRSSPRSR
jgi:hypothetical protein